jgi:formate/nitrite transporter FocA (FNT family)
VLRFWAIAWVGNLVGAWLFGTIVGALALVAIPFWYAFARQDRGPAG